MGVISRTQSYRVRTWSYENIMKRRAADRCVAVPPTSVSQRLPLDFHSYIFPSSISSPLFLTLGCCKINRSIERDSESQEQVWHYWAVHYWVVNLVLES